MSEGRVVLVTGFPGTFLAIRVAKKILESEPETELRCVVPESFMEKAKALLDGWPEEQSRRVRLILGDVASMDLGLSGSEFLALAAEVSVIHHCAAVTYLGVERDLAERLNIGGTAEVLELCREAERLERLIFWSSALVSGRRRGLIKEDELPEPPGFRNVVEETRFIAERMVRQEMPELPVTILRPSILVGDSQSGEIDRLEGPYLLVLLMLHAPVDLRVPLPGRGEIPLNLVPVDYVVEAGTRIAKSPRSIGHAYHLVDPNPMSAQQVFDRIVSEAGQPLPKGFLPTNLATALLRTPSLTRFAQAPRTFFEQLATEVVYDHQNARAILRDSGLKCPSFDSYASVMVEYVRSQQEARRASSADLSEDLGQSGSFEIDDPLV